MADASRLHGSDPATSSRLVDHWIRQAQAGSRSALGRVLEASRKYLLLVADRALDDELRRKVGGSDLVQETFTEAQRGFHGFHGKTEGELYAWLMGILTHRLANNVRRYRTTDKRTIDRELSGEAINAVIARVRDASLTPCTAAIAHEEERRVRTAMAQLPPSLREIIVMRTWQRQPFAEIGAQLGCSSEAARKRWAAAVKALEQILSGLN